MTAENFQRCLSWVLAHEGGYVNHPKDPGGATNRGVTQTTYDAFTGGGKDVRDITDEDVRTIYRRQYWDAVRADDLPGGVDYAVFDFAVNSGPSRAAKFLQAVVGANQDGIVGFNTLASVHAGEAASIAARLCDDRLAWVRKLSTFSTFGKGWTKRINAVRDRSVNMADGAGEPLAPGKAEGRVKPSVAVKEAIIKPETVTGVAGAVTGILGSLQGIGGPLGIALAVVIAAAGLAAVAVIARRYWKASDA